MISRRSLLAAALAAPLAACAGQGSRAPAASTLTVGLSYIPNVQFAAFYVGQRQGIFAEHGLQLQLRHHGAQEDVFGALLAGREDVVFASGDEATLAAAQGAELDWLATSYQQFPAAIYVPESSGITSVADLSEAGRTIGLPGHYGSNYIAALSALHHAGLSEADVALVDIGYTQVSALMTGKVAAVVGYRNNEAVQFAAQGFAVRELAVQPAATPSLIGPGLVARRGKLSDQTATALSQALLAAEQQVAANVPAAVEIASEYVPTLADAEQQAAARKVLAATVELWRRDGVLSVTSDSAAFARMAQLLLATKVIAAEPTSLQVRA